MSKSIFIVGTNTDIGKTFVAGGIIHRMKKEDINACYFKPIQSGVEENDESIESDVAFVKSVSSINQEINTMNTYSFKDPVSPHLAAKGENILIDKEKILKQYEELKSNYDYVVVEGAGGVIVPLSEDYYIYDLIKDLDIGVIVVANAGVGTINHTCLTIDFLKRSGIVINGIIINKYRGSFYEDDNIKMIEQISKVKVRAVLGDIDKDLKNSIIEEYDKNLNKCNVLELFKNEE